MTEFQNQTSPILSICIPTFNRCGYLYFALKSIVEQDIFKNTFDVEVVILDNASNDLTEQIVKIFSDKFPDKIRYHRNETHIEDEKFEKIFTLAHGEVLKIHHDNFIIIDGALDLCIEKIKEFREERPIIFFANKHLRFEDNHFCNNLNEFVETASYLITDLDAFSIWREDLDSLKSFTQFNSAPDAQFKYADFLLRLSAKMRSIYVWDEEIFEERGEIKEIDYNIAKVFVENYLPSLKQYLKNSTLDKKIYEREKKLLLLDYIIPAVFSLSGEQENLSEDEGYWRYLINDYWYNPYFYTSIVQVVRQFLKTEIQLIWNRFDPNFYQKCWRQRNEHNETTISKNSDDTKVFVGRNCTGNIDVKFSINENELLIIEDNVTIESGTKFVFGTKDLIIVKDGTMLKKGSVVTR